MLSEGSKRIVIIKDINSNMIEEAILILKKESLPAMVDNSVAEGKKEKKNAPDFLLKEAQVIIENYFKENKSSFKSKTRREARKKLPINKLKISRIINITLIGSLVILVLMLTKLI